MSNNINTEKIRKKLEQQPSNLGLNIDKIIKEAYQEIKNRQKIE